MGFYSPRRGISDRLERLLTDASSIDSADLLPSKNRASVRVNRTASRMSNDSGSGMEPPASYTRSIAVSGASRTGRDSPPKDRQLANRTSAQRKSALETTIASQANRKRRSKKKKILHQTPPSGAGLTNLDMILSNSSNNDDILGIHQCGSTDSMLDTMESIAGWVGDAEAQTNFETSQTFTFETPKQEARDDRNTSFTDFEAALFRFQVKKTAQEHPRTQSRQQHQPANQVIAKETKPYEFGFDVIDLCGTWEDETLKSFRPTSKATSMPSPLKHTNCSTHTPPFKYKSPISKPVSSAKELSHLKKPAFDRIGDMFALTNQQVDCNPEAIVSNGFMEVLHDQSTMNKVTSLDQTGYWPAALETPQIDCQIPEEVVRQIPEEIVSEDFLNTLHEEKRRCENTHSKMARSTQELSDVKNSTIDHIGDLFASANQHIDCNPEAIVSNEFMEVLHDQSTMNKVASLEQVGNLSAVYSRRHENTHKCSICHNKTGNTKGKSILYKLPCCNNIKNNDGKHEAGSNFKICSSCIKVLTTQVSSGTSRVGRCPQCRSWLEVEATPHEIHFNNEKTLKVKLLESSRHTPDRKGSREPQGKKACSVCCRPNRLLVDKQKSLCDACFLGKHCPLIYKCQKCRSSQRIPHPMYRYQEAANLYGNAKWKCGLKCNAYTCWRIQNDQLPLIPIGDTPIKWGWPSPTFEIQRARLYVQKAQNEA